MFIVPGEKMFADEFLPWSEAQEGRWELHGGEPVRISPERVDHVQMKANAAHVLRRAVLSAGVQGEAFPNGPGVRIDAWTVFEPDALVYCGARLSPDALEIPDPVVVVEVISPQTAARDHGAKLTGYFSLPSIMHYLILDPERRVLIHHKRGQGGIIETRILTEGLMRLDPPGLEAPVADMFAAA
jgi:Uma2 family endonuclease